VVNLTEQMEAFFHNHWGVFVWNGTGRGVYDHNSVFKQHRTQCWI